MPQLRHKQLVRQILITRAEPDASATAARVAALGLVPIVAPILEVSPTNVEHPPSSRIGAVILTSRNAITPSLSGLHAKPTFAVGPATAACASKSGFAHVINADGDAEALTVVVARELSPSTGTVYLPTTSGQGMQIADALRKREFRVTRRVAYQVLKLPALPKNAVEAFQNGLIGAALFFSTESARHFVHLLVAARLREAVHNVEAVSISPRPVVPLKRLPWRRISVAKKPNQDAMLALLT